ncbi:DUF1003 domain-containing protein [Weeksellaceae bacterium A-14]|uniref:DUF1003 domain-containing protein n=1 Tax=Daejeonia sp. YH14 TaxID=3439042 RepID=UPI0031E4DC81
MNTFTSDISGKSFPETEKVQGKNIRYSLLNYIHEQKPGFGAESVMANEELNTFREKYISNYLTTQLGELTELEKEVVNSITQKTTLASKLADEDDHQSEPLGDRLADRVANFGGSWKFILFFSGFLILWIGINALFLHNKGFDPYPFILLNLFLSCVAALQAPVIMMSQNRQEDKDRQRAKKDYMINLKSELEIRALHEKLDHMIIHQQQELLEIQKIQIEMLNDIMKTVSGEVKSPGQQPN